MLAHYEGLNTVIPRLIREVSIDLRLAKVSKNSGVKKVLYGEDYPDKVALRMLIGAGIETSNIIWLKDDEIGVSGGINVYGS